MAKNNATCHNCGKGYYICRSCESIFSWRQVACCPECFRELQSRKNQNTKGEKYEVDTEPRVAQTKKSGTNKSVAKKPSSKKK